MTDWQRPLLLGGMAIVVFLLILEWNAFQTRQQQAPDQTTLTSAQPAPAPDASADTPSASTTPSALPEAEPDSDTTAPLTPTAEAQQLISVRTDVLDVLIDPLGGDIVKVAMPEHQEELGATDKPLILLNRTASHTYVAQSGLIGPNGIDTAEGRPTYQVERNEWTLNPGDDELVVTLNYQQDGVRYEKRFVFERGEYLVSVEYRVDNQTEQPWQGNFFGQIKRDSYAPPTDTGIGVSPFLGAALTTPDERYKKYDFDDIREETVKLNHTGGWIAMVQHYFISAWIPRPDDSNRFLLRQLGNSDLFTLGYTGPRQTIPAGASLTFGGEFYAGPKDVSRLEEIAEFLDLTVDYGWLWWIAKPLFVVLDFFHEHTGNWGVAIILLTLCVKILFFYPSAMSYRSMAKMRKLTPKMQELRETYSDNRQRMSEELMKLYRKEKVNPLGGCLPILIQMPVFIALYWVLLESVELRHAGFALWIDDLSVKDPYFILPLLMGASMYFQQKLNPTPPDPTQARILQLMPIMFTFFFLWFPAGLVLYWTVNNLLSMTQQYIITRQIERGDTQ